VGGDERPLDLVLYGPNADPYGARVGVIVGDDAVLHLCAEVNRPAVWSEREFARRERYSCRIGVRRCLPAEPKPISSTDLRVGLMLPGVTTAHGRDRPIAAIPATARTQLTRLLSDSRGHVRDQDGVAQIRTSRSRRSARRRLARDCRSAADPEVTPGRRVRRCA
jgi:hypothetical protein